MKIADTVLLSLFTRNNEKCNISHAPLHQRLFWFTMSTDEYYVQTSIDDYNIQTLTDEYNVQTSIDDFILCLLMKYREISVR